jgi:hypothetical protein
MHQEFSLLEKPSFLIQNSVAIEGHEGHKTSDYVRCLGTKCLKKGINQTTTGSVKEVIVVTEPSQPDISQVEVNNTKPVDAPLVVVQLNQASSSVIN